MKKEKINRKKIEIGAAVLTATVFCVAGLLLMSNVSHPFVEDIVIEERRMKDVFLLPIGDNDPGTGASGLVKMGVAKTGTTWTSNLSAADYWEETDTNDSSAGTDAPYGTDLYIFFKIRWNATHAGTGISGEYNLSYVEGWLNSTSLSISALEMTEANVSGANNDLYIWCYYYAGPYQITKGQVIANDNIIGNFRAYS